MTEPTRKVILGSKYPTFHLRYKKGWNELAVTTTNFFFEAHHIQHFNGLLVNNIPLVKLLRVQAVVGAGVLWVQDAKVRHEEIFAGLERTFKLGARRRLRVGVYGVLANSNISNTDTAFRIYIDVIDTFSMDWNFRVFPKSLYYARILSG